MDVLKKLSQRQVNDPVRHRAILAQSPRRISVMMKL